MVIDKGGCGWSVARRLVVGAACAAAVALLLLLYACVCVCVCALQGPEQEGAPQHHQSTSEAHLDNEGTTRAMQAPTWHDLGTRERGHAGWAPALLWSSPRCPGVL